MTEYVPTKSDIVMVLNIGVWRLDSRKLFDLGPSKMSENALLLNSMLFVYHLNI